MLHVLLVSLTFFVPNMMEEKVYVEGMHIAGPEALR